MNKPIITVIIPTYKPDGTFKKLLHRLEAQTFAPDQIIVVNTDEKSFDNDLIEGSRHVELIHITKEDFDHGGTRDMAAGLARGEILVFMTMDAVPKNRHMLENLVEPLSDPQTACSYGRQLPAKGCDVLERYTRQFNYGDQDILKSKADMETLGIKTFFCSNVCAAYRRDIYDRLGGFIQKTIFNEDMIFAAEAIRAGYNVAYASKALVIHSHNYSGRQQLHRNFDLGVSQAQNPEIFEGVKSESEGMRMIKSEMIWLIKSGHILQIPRLIYISGCKYLGYRLGKKYDSLPGRIVRALSMNKNYWS